MQNNMNPWERLYNHPAFESYTKEQIDEMTLAELFELCED